LERGLQSRFVPLMNLPNQSSQPTPASGTSCAGHKPCHRWRG
jgi:hypothetical protein